MCVMTIAIKKYYHLSRDAKQEKKKISYSFDILTQYVNSLQDTKYNSEKQLGDSTDVDNANENCV